MPQAFLDYRDPSDDAAKRFARRWALARAWFYAILFTAMLIGITTVCIVALMSNSVDANAVAGTLFATILFGSMTFMSIRSLALLYTRRISFPFESHHPDAEMEDRGWMR